jgi:MFS transporter, UMF1 family
MTDSADDKRQGLHWALYDFGNSAFSTTVMAGFFPLFFKQYWSAGQEATTSTFLLGLSNSVASLLVLLCAPVLGALSDRGRRKKLLLASFVALGCCATLGLSLVVKGDYASAALLYATATLGFSGSLVFYDALIVSVAKPEHRDRVSAFGFALGYLGGGLLFAINVLMTLKPTLFGLADAAAGVRVSFVTVALWWALFTIPLLRFVREPPATASERPFALGGAIGEVMGTLARIRALPQVWGFLLAYFLYIDGVDTIIRMAVDYGMSLGLPSQSLIIALLITQFVGFPAAIGFGKIARHIGTRRGILLGIGVYILVTVLGYFMQTAAHFYALAVIIGLVQGGVQALSRSFYSRIIPQHEAGEFFGFYNMLGKFAAVIGPALMGSVGLITGSTRASILSIAILFIAGGALLLRVEEPRSTP